MRSLALFLLGLLVWPLRAAAEEVETLYLKNNGYSAGYVWVNGQYQGYVPAGTARYTLMEGFVTNDSGFQPDGTLKQTHSHAGWESSRGTIGVRINMADSKGQVLSTDIDTSGDKENKAYVWFAENNAGAQPDPLTWEESSQIQNTSAPKPKRVSDGNCYAATKGSNGFLGAWSWSQGSEWETITLNADGTYQIKGEERSEYNHTIYEPYTNAGHWTIVGENSVSLSSRPSLEYRCVGSTLRIWIKDEQRYLIGQGFTKSAR
jgi:hypothetical protein